MRGYLWYSISNRVLPPFFTNPSCLPTLVSDAAHAHHTLPSGYRRTLSAAVPIGLNDPVCHGPVVRINTNQIRLHVQYSIIDTICQRFFCRYFIIFTICSLFLHCARAQRRKRFSEHLWLIFIGFMYTFFGYYSGNQIPACDIKCGVVTLNT